jgi:hypothetical protein
MDGHLTHLLEVSEKERVVRLKDNEQPSLYNFRSARHFMYFRGKSNALLLRGKVTNIRHSSETRAARGSTIIG